MVRRISAILVVTGLVLELTLSGVFVILGMLAMMAGVIVLAIQLEASLVTDFQPGGASGEPGRGLDVATPATAAAAPVRGGSLRGG
jgi:hypothetical protein